MAATLALWKKLNQQKIQSLHPVLAQRCEAFLDDLERLDIPVLVTEGYRDWERQDYLYSLGRTTESTVPCSHGPVGSCPIHPFGATVTNARAGYGWHNYALAFDGVPDDIQKQGLQADWNVRHPAWQQMLRVGKLHKLAEGAEWRTFPDYPHFQPVELMATPGDGVRKRYREGGIARVWEWYGEYLKENKNEKIHAVAVDQPDGA